MKKVFSFLSASLIALSCSLSFQACEDKDKEKAEDTVEEVSNDIKEEATPDSVGNREAREQNDEKFDKPDEKNANYVVNAVEYNYMVIEMSKLAIEKSNNKDLVKIAKDLKTSHNRQLGELQALAKKKGITVPTQETMMAENKIEKLEEKDGDKFNKKWTNKMIDIHKMAIGHSEKALENEKIQADEKEWINANLPSLRTHLEKLQDLDGKLK